MFSNVMKPLTDLVSFNTNWISFQTNYMLDELVELALRQFPISFPDKTNAEILFFAVVNRKLLLEERFEIHFEGDNSDDRRKESRGSFEEMKKALKHRVDELKIYLDSEVSFVMQGIAYTPHLYQHWHIPYVDSRRDRLGVKIHRGSSQAHPSLKLPNDPVIIQDMITNNLLAYGIEQENVPRLADIEEKNSKPLS